MQYLPEIRKLPEIIAAIDRIPKLIQIIVEHTTQYLAGSVADHRDVHRNQIPFKGGIPALLDSVPKALPGLFTKSIHADDFSPVTIQTVNIQITMDKSLTDEFSNVASDSPSMSIAFWLTKWTNFSADVSRSQGYHSTAS